MLNIEPDNGREDSNSRSADARNTPSRDPACLDGARIAPRPLAEVEMVLTGAPLEPAVEMRIQERGGLRWVNFYPGTLDRVVVGCDQLHFPTHESVHTGLMEALWGKIEKLPAEALNDLRNSKVDGFRDGANYIVRIEDHAPLIARVEDKSVSHAKRTQARAELDVVLAKYRRAVELAGIACQGSGGEVFLQAEGPAQITIAKMLGRLHQASSQDNLTGPAYIARSRQENIAGTFFYSRTTGTRFKTADQFESMAAFVDNQERFVEGLVKMREWMSTDNQRGSREAQFLIIDPISGELVSKGPDIDHMLRYLDDLILTCGKIENDWEARKYLVFDQIHEMAEYLRSLNHPDFKRDDFANTSFVHAVSEILKRGGNGLALGPEFSTPLRALEIGHFQSYGDNQREFVHSTSELEHERLISWVQRRFPETKGADWLCLCCPDIPLTFDHHPSSFVRSFGDIDTKSYVVFFGKLGEPERRYVIRENAYAAERWKDRHTKRVAELLEEYDPEYLTSAVYAFQKSQYVLAHALGEAADSQFTKESDMFELISVDPTGGQFGDHEYRPFYDGQRVDRESLMTWNREQVEECLIGVGELIAKKVIKQAPIVSSSDLVISTTSKGAIPLTLLSLSESETFCHSLDIKSSKKYLNTIPTLYGAYIASWVESFCQGESVKGLNASQVNRIRQEMIRNCLKSFRDTYRKVTGPGRAQFQDAIDTVRSSYDEFFKDGKGPIPELDMRTSLALTEQLVSLTSAEINDLTRDIKLRTTQYCGILRRALRESPSERSSVKAREDLINSVYSLVSNHFSDVDRFRSILSLLPRDVRSSERSVYSLRERTWLYTVVNVGAWLSAIGGREKSLPLLHSARSSGNVEAFLSDTEATSGLNLSQATLTRFFEAVEGLRTGLDGLPKAHPKRRQLNEDIAAAYALRGLIK